VVDIESEGMEVTPETLQYIHAHKTGALIHASCMAGAILCEGSEAQLGALSAYGQSIGLAFQIADDILDIVGDERKIGKPVGSDEKQDKATFPRLYGLEESRRRARNEVARALDALSSFGESAEPLRAIARYIVERDF
jgi:geranylgeranyl diphosphate synthase type II